MGRDRNGGCTPPTVTGTIGKHASIVALQRRGKAERRGFQMTLQTNFHAPCARKPRWIDDGLANPVERVAAPGCVDVSLTATMATLAIDTVGKRRRKARAVIPGV